MINNSKKEIEALVRAIIYNKGKLLVCKNIGKKYYFFPGGHLEFGENAKKGLTRELKEELGLTVKKCSFIGGSEHIFIKDGIKRHEINLAFQVSVKGISTKSRENHLQFFLIDKKQLIKKNVLPKTLKKAVFKWLRDKKPFWVSQI